MVIVKQYNGVVADHKVQVPTHTFFLVQPYPTSWKKTLLQAHEKESIGI